MLMLFVDLYVFRNLLQWQFILDMPVFFIEPSWVPKYISFLLGRAYEHIVFVHYREVAEVCSWFPPPNTTPSPASPKKKKKNTQKMGKFCTDFFSLFIPSIIPFCPKRGRQNMKEWWKRVKKIKKKKDCNLWWIH